MAPRALTDEAWAEICAAAARHDPPLVPDDGTREEMSAVLFSKYPSYDRERLAATFRRAERMLKHLAAFEADYCANIQLPTDDVKTEADLWFVKMLRRRPDALWNGCQALRRANEGHRNSRYEWLVSQLCGIWLDHFRAPYLTVSVPATGGEPRGPLMDFMRAALRQAMPKQPKAQALRKAIYRERIGRENAKQLWLELKQREARKAQGVSTREKKFRDTI
jgi:hypothetical protein